MTQTNSIQIMQPWTLLHEPPSTKPKLDRLSEAERAAATRRFEAKMNHARDKVFAEFTLCGRPYF